MHTQRERSGGASGFEIFWSDHRKVASKRCQASSEEEAVPDEPETPLDDAVRSEREYVQERLREELKREPTEVELDEWLRQHTEGY